MASEQLIDNVDLDNQIDSNSDQYLTFMLANEEYGVDILKVQEIKGWDETTEIPNTPEYVRGVINLRGTIVPIVDLRSRFDMKNIEYTKTTVVIVLKINNDNGERTIGFVVDAVSDVYKVSKDQFQLPPDFGAIVTTEFIRGMATVDNKMIILLDVDNLVDADIVDEQSEELVQEIE